MRRMLIEHYYRYQIRLTHRLIRNLVPPFHKLQSLDVPIDLLLYLHWMQYYCNYILEQKKIVRLNKWKIERANRNV